MDRFGKEHEWFTKRGQLKSFGSSILGETGQKMQLFINGIGSLLSQFLKYLSFSAVLGCFAACFCTTAVLRRMQAERVSRGFVAYCALLSLYTTFVIAVTLLGRKQGTVAISVQNPLAMPYTNEVEHAMDIAYNAMLFAPFGFLLAMRQKPLVAVGIVTMMSIAIEVVQYETGRGLFEMSDILGNFIGGVIGACVLLCGRQLLSQWRDS